MKKPFFILIILILFFSLVDILGLALRPADSFYYRPDTDINVYFTYLDQARTGRFWFCNQFAVEEDPCKLFFPLWYAGGRLGYWFNFSNLAVIMIFRAVFLTIFFYLLWFFVKKIFPKKALASWLLIIFSGGLYLYYLHGNFFISAMQNPLNIFIATLLLLLLWLSFDLWQKFSLTRSLWLAPLSFLIILAHPYEAFVLIINYSLLVLFSAWMFVKKFKQAIIILIFITIGILLAGIYHFKVFATIPAYQGWLLDNYLPFKGWSSVVINAGLFLPLALIGFLVILKNKKNIDAWIVIASWFIGGLIAVILPLYVNVKFLLAWYFGLAFLGVFGFWFIISALSKKWRLIGIVFLSGLLLSSNFYFYFDEVKEVIKRKPPRYLPASYLESLNWFKQNASVNDVVLASPSWDTFISGYAGLKSLVGSNQVFKQAEKRDLVFWFFKDNTQNDFKKNLLKELKIKYLYYSPREDVLGDFNPEDKNYLQLQYENSWAKIYQVIW